MDESYDQEFKQLKELKKKLTWLPWVGEHYSVLPAENRVLLIGESHYLTDSAGSKAEHEKDNLTRRIVGSKGIDQKGRSNFYINTQKLMLGNGTLQKRERYIFWSRLAFYNFIQTPMDSLKHRPTEEHMLIASDNFIDVIKVLKPSVCVFLGLGAAEKLNEVIHNSAYKFEREIGGAKKVGKNTPRIGRIIAPDGQVIKLLFVKHPSSYFSPGSWNLFLTKNAPSQMKWFKSLININKAA
ncbi:hypothetical protein [Mucilaginibacter ginsenosidivorax]|nr:hypothetical protein [Mucilaginibacter ginsenosidivorax]